MVGFPKIDDIIWHSKKRLTEKKQKQCCQQGLGSIIGSLPPWTWNWLKGVCCTSSYFNGVLAIRNFEDRMSPWRHWQQSVLGGCWLGKPIQDHPKVLGNESESEMLRKTTGAITVRRGGGWHKQNGPKISLHAGECRSSPTAVTLSFRWPASKLQYRVSVSMNWLKSISSRWKPRASTGIIRGFPCPRPQSTCGGITWLRVGSDQARLDYVVR